MQALSKKLLTIILGGLLALGFLLVATPSAYAEEEIILDEINFPDEGFSAYVSEKVDTDGSNTLSQDEINAVVSMAFWAKDIKDFKGIEHFKNLKELKCRHMPSLTSLDISQNTNLEILACHNNENLEALDISNNPNLVDLNCSGNKLTSLDVSNNPNLTDINCRENEISSLDVTNNTKLKRLDCSSNNLSQVDLSKNANLTDFYCHKNEFTQLDVSQNSALTWLVCYDNQLTSLDLSNNSALQTFEGNQNYSLNNFDQVYAIRVNKSNLQYDLSKLPKGFDLKKAGSWNGASVSESILTLDADDVTEVQYIYTASDTYKLGVTLKVLPTTYYKISFNPGEGTGEMDDQLVPENDNYVLPECSFTAPEGKEFKAWSIEGVDEEKAVGDTIQIDADTAVTALWKDAATPNPTPKPNQDSSKDIHILTFNFPGYELVIDGKTYKDQALIPVKDGEAFTMPEGPKRQGYVFAYWEGSKYYAGQKYEFTSDHSLTAVWKVADESAIKRPSSDRYARDDFYSEGAQQQVVKAKPSALPKTGETSNNFALYSILAASGLLALVAVSKPLSKRD
ncbi:MAG: InlB B-repeat-containing protein [Coriobacteriia bacterium]|nr:InlB B-repeat-containing protein [Coriobacteriia bacterium]